MTAIMLAAVKGNIEVAKLLLQAKAELDLLDQSNNCALNLSFVPKNGFEITRLLLENNANVRRRDKVRYFIYATYVKYFLFIPPISSSFCVKTS